MSERDPAPAAWRGPSGYGSATRRASTATGWSAVREMLEGGPLDVLTGDYLAELTMLILGRDRAQGPRRAATRTPSCAQMEECLGLAAGPGRAIVVNAGGLNPAGLAAALRELAGRLGLAGRGRATSRATTCCRGPPSSGSGSR